MHMIATNLCEWLYVLVEETKHEIVHLSSHHNNTSTFTEEERYCQEGTVMGALVTNASPFLFPCKIEYSLICAVILFEMWKKMKTVKVKGEEPSKSEDKEKTVRFSESGPLLDSHDFILFGLLSSRLISKNVVLLAADDLGPSLMQSNNQFSVDCSNAHRGLFSGILVIVLTIISLIMFFVLINEPGPQEDKYKYKRLAEFEVNIVELVLYIVSTLCILVAMIQMRDLKYDRKIGEGTGLGMDNTLLLVAQTGMFIYCMFSIIGCYFTLPLSSSAGLLADSFSLIQTCLQTLFVLDGWWRKCKNLRQAQKKPGRELITFLIIANMAMWCINALEKNRAEFRPSHLHFFGDWAWTIITHISMPLAIFYRFHSTICLFEIWKSAYKIKKYYKTHPILSYL